MPEVGAMPERCGSNVGEEEKWECMFRFWTDFWHHNHAIIKVHIIAREILSRGSKRTEETLTQESLCFDSGQFWTDFWHWDNQNPDYRTRNIREITVNLIFGSDSVHIRAWISSSTCARVCSSGSRISSVASDVP